jgi:guanosine-3',5'-bis(diphosphate) 3'-pyrophosphohydrolase
VAHQAPLLHLPEDRALQSLIRPGLRSARRPRHYPGCGACYAVFGLIHTLWRPVPGRIKDFIAIPRANRYQSLHTTVIGEGGHQFEVQIRTEEMHRIAEEGIAAHWKYKAGDGAVTSRDEERLNWIRQLVEWQKEMTDPNEFLSSLKMDLYPDEVYTFTPKGKVVVVPADATPVDFAYTIHTEVGHTCVGAKVNGRMVPLRTKLRTGDIVEVVTQKDHKPSRDWLTFVKSPRARNKIKHWLNEDQRIRAVEIGRKLLEREARKFKVPMSQIADQDLDASPTNTAWPQPPTCWPRWARASTPRIRC